MLSKVVQRMDIALFVIVVLLGSSMISAYVDSTNEIGIPPRGIVQRTGEGIHNITLFLHNVSDSEASKSLPGSGSTWNWFDTTADFNDVNTTLTATGTNNRFVWYLYPELADDVNTTEVALMIWAKSGMGSSQNANIGLEVFERSSSGEEISVGANNLGSQTFPATGTLWTWSVAFSPYHNFKAGSSIKVVLNVNPGTSKTVHFYFDSMAANSRVIIPTADHITVADILTYDSEGQATTNLDVMISNKTAEVRATVDDPFGGYDVMWANITIEGPSGVMIAETADMERVAGTPIGLTTTFSFVFNYSGLPSGRYDISIWALDNSGYNLYHHFAQYSFGEYPVTGSGFFYIGELPYLIWINVKDDFGASLAGATIAACHGNDRIVEEMVDTSGLVNFTLSPGVYTLKVFWQDLIVYSVDHDVSSNITSDSPLIIKTAVYYTSLRVLDSASVPIFMAAVYLIHPNGTRLATLQTDQNGDVVFDRAPGGDYGLEVRWRGALIKDTVLGLDHSGQYLITGEVYYLTIKALDQAGDAMVNIGITAFENETGLILDFKLTGTEGLAVLRTPATEIDLLAYWFNMPVSEMYDIELNGDRSVTMVCSVYDVPVKVVDSRSAPVEDALVVFRTAVSGDLFSSSSTEDDGIAHTRLIMGTFRVEVTWNDVMVLDSPITIEGPEMVTLVVEIYYLDLKVVDDLGIPVEDAAITVSRSDSTSVYDAVVTNATGDAILKVPVGTYDFEVRWFQKTIYVGSSVLVDQNRELTFGSAVFYLTVIALSKEGEGIKGVDVQVYDINKVIDKGMLTSMNGSAVFRLPGGNYTVDLTLKDTVMFKEMDLERTGSVQLNSSRDIEFDFSEYPPSFFSTPLFYASILPMVLLSILICVAIYLLLRRRPDDISDLE